MEDRKCLYIYSFYHFIYVRHNFLKLEVIRKNIITCRKPHKDQKSSQEQLDFTVKSLKKKENTIKENVQFQYPSR